MGVPVGAGTDATRVASYNPFVSLYWLVTGKTVGGTTLYPETNRLERTEALRLYTVGSSWFSSDEGKKGSIAAGQLADLAVLSADYFSIPEEQIKQLESVLTIVGGKVVYATKEFAKLAPPPLPVSPGLVAGEGLRRSLADRLSNGAIDKSSGAMARMKLGGAHNRKAAVGAGSPWWLGCGCFV